MKAFQRGIWGSLVFLALVACSARADSPWPDRDCPEALPSQTERTQRISLIRQTTLNALLQTSPYLGEVGGGVFNGNYDWHSSVHGHWTLLAIARLTHDDSLESLLLSRLGSYNLSRERAYLNANPEFELPYGQAWLLLMLDELARRPSMKHDDELRGLRRETRDRVLNWLETASFPEPGGLIGTHQSWLFAYLLTQMSATHDPELRARLRVLRKTKLNPARPEIALFKPDPWDFLDLAYVLAVVDKVTPGVPVQIVPVGPSVPFYSPIHSTNAHTAGAAMVRLWPLGMQSQKDPASCARFQTRMTEMFATPAQWFDGFETVSHWVPQFMWMGLWLEMGRP